MELTKPASEFEPKPTAPQPVLEGPLDKLLEWQAMAAGKYSANTLSGAESGWGNLSGVLRGAW